MSQQACLVRAWRRSVYISEYSVYRRGKLGFVVLKSGGEAAHDPDLMDLSQTSCDFSKELEEFSQ